MNELIKLSDNSNYYDSYVQYCLQTFGNKSYILFDLHKFLFAIEKQIVNIYNYDRGHPVYLYNLDIIHSIIIT